MTTRIAIWPNQRKTDPKHPDGRGHLEITVALLQELAYAYQQNPAIATTNYLGEPCIRLDLAAWRSNGQNPQAPMISGSVSTLAETQKRAAELAQWKAQQEGNGNGGWLQPQAPQQPAPQQGGWPQQPQAAPQPAPAPAPPAPPQAAPTPPPAPAPGGFPSFNTPANF